MSAYAQLLDLARTQVANAKSGDVDSAISLMTTRQRVIDAAPPASAADAPLIQEVLVLDRQLAGFLRERMLRIREEGLKLQRGQAAMRGYGTLRHPGGVRLNSAS
jgi:Flagellar protein FliT